MIMRWRLLYDINILDTNKYISWSLNGWKACAGIQGWLHLILHNNSYAVAETADSGQTDLFGCAQRSTFAGFEPPL